MKTTTVGSDPDTLYRAATLFLPKGAVTELRIPDAGRNRTISGYYNDIDRLVADAQILNQRYGTTYILLNQPKAAVLARRANRFEDWAKQTTTDTDIERRRWFLLDQDAVRPAGISASDAEHAAALARTDAVREYLAAAGWPSPVTADSGNGGHLLYPIDLANDETSKRLLKHCLEALDLRFSDEAVVIDTTTFNAARLTKLYGTVAGKGDSTPDRPHRLARLLHVPDERRVVPIELLEALAATRRREPEPGRNGHQRFSAGDFDLDRWIADHDLPVVASGPWQQGGRKWVLNPCPFEPAHQNRSAYIVQLGNGAIGAHCHHNGCQWDWHDLRRLYEPEREPWRQSEPSESRASSKHAAPAERQWPDPPGAAAFRGLAGQIVETIAPHTEADPVALLVSLLGAFGSAAGCRPHSLVGATRHTPRIYAALVGRTAKARKGDSWQPIRAVMNLADHSWSARVVSGLSSGEGLIYAVRDPIEKKEKNKKTGDYETTIVDEGIQDKRLFVVEPELARVLKVMSRQGNTLSPVLRDAWDHGDLRSLTKNSPLQATGAHIALLSHITVEELRRELPDVELANGLANRWHWYAVRRSKLLPDPDPLDAGALGDLALAVARMLAKATQIGRMERSAEASALWREVYEDLSEERDGLAGALLARAEAQVLRLSMIYALLDGTATITVEHLTAALELWAYAERSVEYIFGAATGDPIADAIVAALRQQGELTRTQIRDLFGRHETTARIDHAMRMLVTRGLVQVETRQTGGRPVEVWRLAE